jgi:acyl-CoA synthetase (AMP-forming)/AMP-acid ligase II
VAFSNDDPLSFMSAFYGCLTAGLVPVPVEVPTTKRVNVPTHSGCEK